MTKAIYTGSFDPLTNGHMDIIRRAAEMYDQLIVAIGTNTGKVSLFSQDEKFDLIKENLTDIDNVQVKIMPGLAVDFLKDEKFDVIVRGLRNVYDYEFERDIAELNYLLGEVETVLLFARPENQNISSTKLKEVAKFKGDISKMVPANVAKAVQRKMNHGKEK